MTEGRGLSLRRWGEELRRRRRDGKGRRRRLWIAAAAGSVVTALLFTLGGRCRPRLVWNATDSSPRGLYLVTRDPSPGTGETVLAWPPLRARRLAAARGYLPATVPLVKTVAAGSGGRVCSDGRTITIDGEVRARLRERDGAGRLLPRWHGCILLVDGQLFLLSPSADAFDGRYFGITGPNELLGKARRLWPR